VGTKGCASLLVLVVVVLVGVVLVGVVLVVVVVVLDTDMSVAGADIEKGRLLVVVVVSKLVRVW
jgi:uncharacterized membrane protein YjgN (DUF898 family)